ncbi:MAG: hypothetical protein ABI843_09855 [Dokdonella sp.]
MKKFFLVAMACALGTTACSHREPNDVQLSALLRSDHADPSDPTPPLDTPSVICLRAWSGEVGLLTGLAVGVASDEGKKACRAKFDGRIADASHNPDKFTFDEVSAPKVVQRAMNLAVSRRLAAVNSSSSRPPPAAIFKPTASPHPGAPAAAPAIGPAVEMGTAGVTLSESEQMCEQLQQKAATSTDPGVKNYGAYCASSLKRTRDAMEAAAAHGDSAKLDAYAKTLSRYASVARGMLDKDSKK